MSSFSFGSRFGGPENTRYSSSSFTRHESLASGVTSRHRYPPHIATASATRGSVYSRHDILGSKRTPGVSSTTSAAVGRTPVRPLRDHSTLGTIGHSHRERSSTGPSTDALDDQFDNIMSSSYSSGALGRSQGASAGSGSSATRLNLQAGTSRLGSREQDRPILGRAASSGGIPSTFETQLHPSTRVSIPKRHVRSALGTRGTQPSTREDVSHDSDGVSTSPVSGGLSMKKGDLSTTPALAGQDRYDRILDDLRGGLSSTSATRTSSASRIHNAGAVDGFGNTESDESDDGAPAKTEAVPMFSSYERGGLKSDARSQAHSHAYGFVKGVEGLSGGLGFGLGLSSKANADKSEGIGRDSSPISAFSGATKPRRKLGDIDESFRKSIGWNTNVLDKDRDPGGRVGLQNLGNTCFMNSILQCLSATTPLANYFSQDRHLRELNKRARMGGRLAKAFGALVKDMWTSRSSVVSPYDFKRHVGQFASRFLGYEQQDAQEFLRFLLDGLHEDLNRTNDKPQPVTKDDEKATARMNDSDHAAWAWERRLRSDDSVINAWFGGQLQSTVECQKCGHRSIVFDPFLDLSVPIPKHCQSRQGSSTSLYGGSYSYSSGLFDYGSKQSCTLQDCFDEFTEEEVLDGEERYRCSKCKKRVKALKQLAIFRFPPILVVHIKRFVYNTYSREKLTVGVKFDCNRVDLRKFGSKERDVGASGIYEVFAISEHSGSLRAGHYTAHCRASRQSGGTIWCYFNDSSVTTSASPAESSSTSYVLFLRQSDMS